MNRNRRYRCLLVAWLSIVVVQGMTRTASAQGFVALSNIDTTDFPLMRGTVVAVDGVGNQIANLMPGDFVLTENGIRRQITLLDCPVLQAPRPLSSVLTIDVSGSMAGGPPNIDIAKAAAAAWIEALPLGASECAVTSFDDGAYVNRDFTTDRTSLLAAVSALNPLGGTVYDAGFMDPNAGGITIAARGVHNRILVFLTDGMGGGNESAILQAALRSNVTVYCIAVGMPAPDLLKNVATGTGGRWFDRVETSDEAKSIYRYIILLEQKRAACAIEWKSGPECQALRRVTLSLPSKGLAVDASYTAPSRSVAQLEIDPAGIIFSDVPPGTTDFRDVTVTARNQPVVLSKITSNDPRVTIISGNVPPVQTLAPGASHTFRVQFAPTDSGRVLARIDLASDACTGNYLYISGGYPGKRPAKPTLKVVVPNGGERFVVGSDTLIEWTGVLPEDSVRLDYSTDGGVSWLPIVSSATGFRYRWKVPNTPSERCLVRAAQLGAESRDSVMVLRIAHGEIHTVAFSPSDSYVVTGGGGLPGVILWNAQTGAPIDTFKYTSASLMLCAFSPDGVHLLTSGSPSVPQGANIWDLTTRQIALQIPTQMSSVAYNRTGSLIASGSVSGSAQIWDAASGAGITSFNCVDRVNSLAFSPDDKLLATAGDSTVRVWEISSTNLVRELTGHGGLVNSVQFNADGSKVVSGSDDRTAIVWDAIAGTALLTLRGHIDRVYSASFSPDGERVLTTSADGTARVWDAENGALLQTFVGHTSLVFGGAWSHSGDRVITGAGDQTARIWDLAPGALQQDLSDSLWEIVRPIVEAHNLEYGDVTVGESRDSVVVAFLCNRSSVPVEVDRLEWAGAHPQDFGLVSDAAPFTLPPDTCIAVEFRFQPTDVGRRSALVRIITPLDTLEQMIEGNGVQRQLEIVARSVDFGPVPIGGFRDSSVSIVIRNVGPSPVRIDDVELRGPDSVNFAVVDGGGSFSLDPGQVRAMKLHFEPEWRGRTSGRLLFDHTGVGSPGIVYLYGEGTCGAEAGSSTVTLAEAAEGVAPGEVIAVPLLLSESSGVSAAGGRFTATFHYDRSVILPLDTGIAVVDGSDGEQMLTLNGAWDGRSDTLAVLHFLTALGDAEATRLMIDAFVWESDCPIEVNRVDAVVRIDVCREGDRARLFLADGEIALKPVRPNPAKGVVEMEYSVIETGRTRLSLVDAMGRTVRVIRDAATGPGKYHVSVDLSGLPSGRYFSVLETPTRRLVRSVQVEE